MPRIVDLSQEIYEGMPVYAGHLETKVWQHHTFADTAPNFDSDFAYQSLGITLCDHGPTHVDALSHLDPRPTRRRSTHGPRAVLRRGHVPGRLRRRAARVHHRRAARAGAAGVPGRPARGRRPVAAHRGGGPFGGTPEYTKQYPGLDQSAADWLRDHKPKVFGVDSPSPDNPADRIYPAHLFSRASGITHYENLANLGEVAGRRFRFFGFPLRIRGGHGSPVRAVAMS